MDIRSSFTQDRAAIKIVHQQAFGSQQSPEIITLIQDLFADPTAQPLLSLVAVQDGQIVGHILFSNVTIWSEQTARSARILAPLAVMPARQNQGIGRQLIHDGLTQLKTDGVDLVFVLGYPDYYGRYGFVPALPLGYEAPYPISAVQIEAWMVQSLTGAYPNSPGKVQCAVALDRPEYCLE